MLYYISCNCEHRPRIYIECILYKKDIWIYELKEKTSRYEYYNPVGLLVRSATSEYICSALKMCMGSSSIASPNFSNTPAKLPIFLRYSDEAAFYRYKLINHLFNSFNEYIHTSIRVTKFSINIINSSSEATSCIRLLNACE